METISQCSTSLNVVNDLVEKFYCDHFLKGECQKEQELLTETKIQFQDAKLESKIYLFFYEFYLIYFHPISL